METSKNSQDQNLSELTSSQADSPARTSALQDFDAESSQETEADCGLSSRGLLGCFDPDSFSLRTSQVSLLTNQCDEFWETFPPSGTMRNGTVYQRPPLVHPISETGFGYLPTPTKSMGAMRGGLTLNADATTCYRKEMTGTRPSGAKIGSSLRWCPEYIREALRTGGLVNPEWIGVLMGFPKNWLMLTMELMETPSSPKSPNGSVGE